MFRFVYDVTSRKLASIELARQRKAMTETASESTANPPLFSDGTTTPPVVVTRPTWALPLAHQLSTLRHLLHERDFRERTYEFIHCLRVALLRQGECRVRRRVGFDNHVTYQLQITSPVRVRLGQADWEELEHQLKRDGYTVTSSDNGKGLTVKC